MKAAAPRIPDSLVIIASMILFCGVLTWFVPAGEFNRDTVVVDGSTREVLVQGSYHSVDSAPQTWQIFSAFLRGFEKQAGIIAFILIIGGAFGVLNSTRAIDYGIRGLLRSSGEGTGPLVITLTMVVFSLFGAVFGMSEETLAFVAISVPLAISMGYDSITGLLMVYVAAHIGFAGAVFNPFTVGIAQGLSGLPLYSGFQYRFVCWLVLTSAIIAVTLVYAARVRRKPESSPMYGLDARWREKAGNAAEMSFDTAPLPSSWATYALTSAALVLFSIFYPLTTMEAAGSGFTFPWIPLLTAVHIIAGGLLLRRSRLAYILLVLLLTVCFLIVGVLGHGWYITEISALFLAMGVVSGMAAGKGGSGTAAEFIGGAKDLISAAIIVGLAGGIIIVLQDGKVLDTILYGLASLMRGTGQAVTASLMYLIQTVLNIFIPSSTAKAALTMPIMAPFSDIVNLSRQTTVLAFQFGDGFTNMVTPTSAVLMGALGIAGIPYQVWLKWFWKILLAFIILGLGLLLVTVAFPVAGF